MHCRCMQCRYMADCNWFCSPLRKLKPLLQEAHAVLCPMPLGVAHAAIAPVAVKPNRVQQTTCCAWGLLCSKEGAMLLGLLQVLRR